MQIDPWFQYFMASILMAFVVGLIILGLRRVPGKILVYATFAMVAFIGIIEVLLYIAGA